MGKSALPPVDAISRLGLKAVDGNCECSSNTTDPQQLPADPIAKFDLAVQEAEQKIAALNLPPSTLQIVSGQSITFNAPNGKMLTWKFDSNGDISGLADGINELRYSAPGNPLLGFQYKTPTTDWTPILSTVTDVNGYVTSFTLHPSGTTTLVPTSTSSQIPGAGAELTSKPKQDGEPKVSSPGTPLENCVKGCAEARNDEADAAQSEFKRCVEAANARTNDCFINAGMSGGVVGLGIGAGIGAAAGAPAGGIGALPGAIIGGLIGLAVGADAALITCCAQGMEALNACQKTYNNKRIERQQKYYNCVSRCYSKYPEESQQ